MKLSAWVGTDYTDLVFISFWEDCLGKLGTQKQLFLCWKLPRGSFLLGMGSPPFLTYNALEPGRKAPWKFSQVHSLEWAKFTAITLNHRNLELKRQKGPWRSSSQLCVCPTDSQVNHEFSSSLATACEFTWCHLNADKWTVWLEPTLVWDASSTDISWLIRWKISSESTHCLTSNFAWLKLHFPINISMIAWVSAFFHISLLCPLSGGLVN